ncbi:MAG: sigma-70 region 4 domain-containing protein [Pseudoxanthomonas suwonensis]|nr:sigma-70 region 4 domain-containing protein [Pseudoxanthomonas suwonensis]
MTSSAATDATIQAFLRGCERRARVFLRWYTGDARLPQTVWTDAATAFRAGADDVPMPLWPRLFWSGLLASRSLQHIEPAGGVAIAGLGRLPRGPRAVLLLRLAAGLDEDTAAQVLGIAPQTYRLALRRAMPRLHDGSDDRESWRLLQERIRADLHGSASTATPVDDAHAVEPNAPRSPASPDAEAAPARWRWPAMALVALLTIAALALTFSDQPRLPSLFGRTPELPPGALWDATITTEPLTALDAPVTVALDATTALLLHPDHEFLAGAPEWSQLEMLAFDAWHAARLADQRLAREREEQAARQAAEGEQAALPPDAGAASNDSVYETDHDPS